MKRNEVVNALIVEGFSSKLLATFSDKQLKTLSERFTVSMEKVKSDPKVAEFAKTNDVEVTEKEGEIDECGCNKEIEECGDEMNLKEWVDKIVSKKYPSTMTTKGEISEMIKKRLSENETMSPMPTNKPKKGHNGVPEFMSYDEIVDVMASPEPTTKPKTPTTRPTTRPRTPFNPKPADNPGPNAIRENKRVKK